MRRDAARCLLVAQSRRELAVMLKVVLARQPCRLGLGAVPRGAYLRGAGAAGAAVDTCAERAERWREVGR